MRLSVPAAKSSFPVMREELRFAPGWPGAVWAGYGIPASRGPQPLHHHAELEGNLVLAGTAHYLVAGQRVDVPAGRLLWLLPDQEHILIGNSRGFRTWVVVWSPAFLAAHGWGAFTTALSTAARTQLPVRRLGKAWPRALAAACPLLSTGAPDATEHPGVATGDLRAVEDGFQFLLSLFRGAWEAAGADATADALPLHPAVATALDVLREHHGNLSLTTLAARVRLSPERLRRLFREQVGSGLPAYRNHLRLDRFQDLALAGSDHMQDLAREAGFGSYAQFRRAYLARFGRSPGRHRQ